MLTVAGLELTALIAYSQGWSRRVIMILLDSHCLILVIQYAGQEECYYITIIGAMCIKSNLENIFFFHFIYIYHDNDIVGTLLYEEYAGRTQKIQIYNYVN